MSDSLIIIPTYNEIENIEAMIRRVFTLPHPFNLLIIDDGSPDGTAQRVKALQTEHPDQLFILERPAKLGLGTAYILGFQWAIKKGYDYIFEMDADFSHNPLDLLRLYNACAIDGYDLAIGSRYVKGVNVVNWPMSRVLMSYFASHYVRFITGLPIADSTAGFKCYRRQVLETIQLEKIHFVGYAFQIEMKFVTWKWGFRIKEVPIIFTDRDKGVSKMSRNIFKEAVFGIIWMKIKSIFNPYQPA